MSLQHVPVVFRGPEANLPTLLFLLTCPKAQVGILVSLMESEAVDTLMLHGGSHVKINKTLTSFRLISKMPWSGVSLP